jgi:NAD(P)H dehydrogenase (quinone)
VITVTGGTGTVGAALTRRLLREGAQVRVLTRDPSRAAGILGDARGLDLAHVDFDDPGSLHAAFRGSRQAFVSMGTSQRQVKDEKALIDAAAAAGVSHLVNLSVGGAGSAFASNILEWHTEIDRYLATRALSPTTIRPATFLDTILRVASSSVIAGTWGGHAGNGRAAFIDSRDVADVAAVILLEGAERHAGRQYDLTGPEPVTMQDLAAQFSAALGRTVRYHYRSRAEQRAVLESAGLPALRVEVLLSLDDLTRAGLYAVPAPATRALTGQQPRPVADLVTQRLAELTAPVPAP